MTRTYLILGATLSLVIVACTNGTTTDPETPATTVTSLAPLAVEPAATTTTAPAAMTTTPAPGWNGLRFSNQTAAAGVEVRYLTPFAEGDDYTPAMSTAKMRGGAAVIDYDRDGWQDLFVLGGGLEPDRLFRNMGDGSFQDMAEAAGIRGVPHLGSAVAAGDYDGDGWQDLFVASHGPVDEVPQPNQHRLWKNNGDGTFTDVAAAAGVTTTALNVADGFGSVFADYDLDGDLDLFVAGWERDSLGNRLFRNNGDGTFDDVTETAGIVDDGIRGFSPCLVDTDGDRYPELLLVADFGTSRYFVNHGDGTFSEATAASGLGLEWSGMGTAVGDVNNDGMIDWYATAIFDDSGDGRGDGNKLYYNLGGHQFEEVAATVGVADGGWGWGAVTSDLNHDGWLDIIEVNGWHFEGYEVYTGERGKVFMADGTGMFQEVAAATGFDHQLMGLSTLTFDYDNDGDQDIAVTAARDAFRLYRNDLESTNNWLRIFLDTSEDPSLAPDGTGARVWVSAGQDRYLRYVGGCANYLGTGELSAHFGLGDHDLVDVSVEWPDGTLTTLTEVSTNQTITVASGAARS